MTIPVWFPLTDLKFSGRKAHPYEQKKKKLVASKFTYRDHLLKYTTAGSRRWVGTEENKLLFGEDFLILPLHWC